MPCVLNHNGKLSWLWCTIETNLERLKKVGEQSHNSTQCRETFFASHRSIHRSGSSQLQFLFPSGGNVVIMSSEHMNEQAFTSWKLRIPDDTRMVELEWECRFETRYKHWSMI